ncbi:Acid sphingomyelinase-like phosphodiesterase 3a [Oryzias melastigma]|uniref:Acid sphingomyelinase-like phosphodiesterase n=1 Tax=Oryzias melastigma TaxID=30732 RepID=A0A3B3CSD1_ORYME|nr:acid sphingomyelinase-like phosphodiesterase 3a [Oryzias melastigma]KAF6732215.1 Acid sphingomyelinase-like phosphodiesterase 3a [Oryzias melastigma]
MAVIRVFLLLLWFGSDVVRTAPAGRSYLAGTGRFWHITDLHLDPTYQLSPDPTKVCFSSKGVPAAHAGVYGDFLCDSPYSLIQSAFAHMAPLTQPQDFIIWTGDSPPHVPPDELSTDMVIQVIRNMTHTIREHFPNLTVYPALGNHDYWPQDQMPASTNAIYKAAAELWKPWLQSEALLTLSEGGFYSQLVKPGLRLVSLNTILYYGPDEVTRDMSDPAGQFEWLQKTLESAAQNQEKVYIIAHVPVGYLPFVKNTAAIQKRHNERLVSIFRKYAPVIAGHFYGHTHRDSIMVLLDQRGEPVNSLFVSPAVTPIKNALELYSNNPGFRMYLYNSQDYSMQDIWQYYLNLTEANQKQKSDWRLEYIMTEAFGLTDLQPQSLLQLGLSFLEPQTKAFDTYFSHFMVSYDRRIVCDGDCKVKQVCAVLYLDQQTYSKCAGTSD